MDDTPQGWPETDRRSSQLVGALSSGGSHSRVETGLGRLRPIESLAIEGADHVARLADLQEAGPIDEMNLADSVELVGSDRRHERVRAAGQLTEDGVAGHLPRFRGRQAAVWGCAAAILSGEVWAMGWFGSVVSRCGWFASPLGGRCRVERGGGGVAPEACRGVVVVPLRPTTVWLATSPGSGGGKGRCGGCPASVLGGARRWCGVVRLWFWGRQGRRCGWPP